MKNNKYFKIFENILLNKGYYITAGNDFVKFLQVFLQFSTVVGIMPARDLIIMNIVSTEYMEPGKVFDIYSPIDIHVVRNVNALDAALIGGSAVQTLARSFGIVPRRRRSYNDLDFIIGDAGKSYKIDAYLRSAGFAMTGGFELTDPTIHYYNEEYDVEADLFNSFYVHTDDFVEMNGLLFWSPVWLYASKIQRVAMPGSVEKETDFMDLMTLDEIISLENLEEEVENVLMLLGIQQETFDRIQEKYLKYRSFKLLK